MPKETEEESKEKRLMRKRGKQTKESCLNSVYSKAIKKTFSR